MSKLNRRRFLGLSAAGGLAASSAVLNGPTALADTTSSTASAFANRGNPRAIIIGSGFGGSVAALRLGKAGVRTTILERGQFWHYSNTQQVFDDELHPGNSMMWFQDTVTWPAVTPTPVTPGPGVMEVSVQNNITIACGAAVGGGSIVYTGCTVQPAPQYFSALYPSGITYAEMDKVYYPRVRSMLNAQTIPSDIYASDPFTHSRTFDAQMAAAGYPTSTVPSSFNWSKVRSELSGSLRPSATIGESNFGNSDGAKNDLTQTYLPAAVATGNVSISPLTVVTGIGVTGNGRYTVYINKLAADGSVQYSDQLTCDLLFVSAGSVNTTKLLVAARDSGALPNLNSAVGTSWGGNGDAFALRAYGDPIGATQASPCASTAFVDSNAGFGLPTRFENWYAMTLDGVPGMVQFSVAVDTDNRGTWTYDPSSKSVSLSDWTAAKNAPAESTAAAFNQMIIDKGLAAAFPIAPPTGFTAHPLGGCPIGQATDLYGRVKGYNGLYVLDGSLIPGNVGGANPSLTIAALAERAMDNIVKCGG